MILKRGYAERGGDVILTMTRADYERLNLALSLVAAYATRDGEQIRHVQAIELANRLNDGNRNWTPVTV